MRTLNSPLKFAAGIALALSTASAFAASAPKPFTAVYEVSAQGQPMGTATITLKALGNGEYEYSNQTKGTSGLAAAMGASSSDVSHLRWHNGALETEQYESTVNAFKVKHRSMQVNWSSNQVSVNDGKNSSTYPAQPGLIDRSALPLALGLMLADGKTSATLPVGVRQRVENQQFKVSGSEAVQTPAGNFTAQKISRSDADNAFSAWYVPGKYPLPVKLAQSDGGDLTLVLQHYSSP